MRECVALAPQIPDTQMVCVMDREADFFELFDEQRKKPRVELLESRLTRSSSRFTRSINWPMTAWHSDTVCGS